MPDITEPYFFCEDFRKRLKEKFSKVGAKHSDWQDDDIMDIRSSIRVHYRQKQKGKCAYCRQTVSMQSASNCHIEHIVSKSKYLDFVDEPKNLCVVCADCNEIKRDQEVLNEIPEIIVNSNIKKYPKASKSFKVVHPHFDNYYDHILVINGFYLDKSTKGSLTISYCKLNRKLHEFGYENPEVSDINLMELMTKYISEKDSLKKSFLLNKLKEELFFV